MIIRPIKNTDFTEVDKLIRNAFTQSEHGYGNESELVDKIRKDKSYIPELELVALENNTIIGYGLLSQVKIVNDSQEYLGLVLAPLATLPECQGQGIGGKLLTNLEDRAESLGYNYISILGHAKYYPRFGYVPASKYHIKAPFDVPDEAFMIKALTPSGLDGTSGTVQYSKAFE